MNSKFVRGTGIRAKRVGETSLEGAALAALHDEDPLAMAAYAGGAQAAATTAMWASHPMLKGQFIKGLGLWAGLYAMYGSAQYHFTDEHQSFSETFEKSAEHFMYFGAAGALSYLGGFSRPSADLMARMGPMADAFMTMPRGAVIAMINDLTSEGPERHKNIMAVSELMTTSPQNVPEKYRERLLRAVENGNLGNVVGDLMKKKDFRDLVYPQDDQEPAKSLH